MNNDNKKRSGGLDWGTGLTIAIALFICATLGVVGFVVSLDYYMVTDNHYEKAVNYQEHIDRVEQAGAMNIPVEIELLRKEGSIEIRFPESFGYTKLSGKIELYRPSDPSLDQTIDLMISEEGIQHIPAQGLAKGKWLVKVNWNSENKSYYKQQSIFL